MKSRFLQVIPVLLPLLVIVITPLSYQCIYQSGSCYGTWISHVYPYFINPLYDFSFYFLPIAIILIFVSRDVFKSWLKFAAWALPLAFILVALTPVTSHGFMDFFPFYRDDAARLAGEVVSVLSIILIAWKWSSLRHRA